MICDPTFNVSANESDGTIQLDTWESTRGGPRVDCAIRDAQPVRHLDRNEHF